MIARIPSDLTACRIIFVIAAGSSMTMLPNPMYTGGLPLRRNKSRSGGEVYSGRERKKKPQTSMFAGQSDGFGIRLGDQQ
jgi:hypothetical protein